MFLLLFCIILVEISDFSEIQHRTDTSKKRSHLNKHSSPYRQEPGGDAHEEARTWGGFPAGRASTAASSTANLRKSSYIRRLNWSRRKKDQKRYKVFIIGDEPGPKARRSRKQEGRIQYGQKHNRGRGLSFGVYDHMG